MRFCKWFIVAAMALGVMLLAGCGGGSSTSVAGDPLATRQSNAPPDQPVFNSNYTITVLPSRTQALTNQEQIVTATLKDAFGKPIANQTVAFSVVAGPVTVLTGSMVTDSNGIALAYVKTGTTSATTNAIIVASATVNGSAVNGYGNFQVSPGDANQISTNLSLSMQSYTVKPNEQVVVTAMAKDSSGNALANQLINFRITTGSATMLTTTATTDSNGKAIALVQSGDSASASNVIMEASTTINGNAVIAVIPFQIVPPQTATVTYSMTLTPSKAVVDNNEDFYVTAELRDSGGNAVPNQSVNFSIATGVGEVNTPTITTDSTGKAIGTIRAGNPGFTMAVIIKASTTAGGTSVTALAPVQISTKQFSQSVLVMTLTSDKATVGINSDVILTTSLTDMQEPPKPVQNQRVTFSVVAGPATIVEPSLDTDSTGTAVTRLKIGAVNSSSSVVVSASATVNGVVVKAYTTIQVVRQQSTIINFITTKVPTDPDGTLYTLLTTLPWDTAATRYGFVQLVPFQVLDENGVPMPKVDVTVSAYSTHGNSTVTVASPTTIVTDDHGMGLFNVSVMLNVPLLPGTSNSDAIVYLATATVNGTSLRSYGGFIATVARDKAPDKP